MLIFGDKSFDSQNGVWRVDEFIDEQTKVKIIVLAAEISKIEGGAASPWVCTDQEGLGLAPRTYLASASR